MKERITVYCGSSATVPPVYIDVARELGRQIALAGAELVTGAGRTGLMGAVAEGAKAAGGTTVGIIPQFMVDRGWHNPAMDELIVTPDMHSRKSRMAESWGCIALPGGIGTFEELCEIMTWRQLGLFDGNVVIYNADEYYNPLLGMFGRAVAEGFMNPDHLNLFRTVYSAAEAVEAALAPHAGKSFSPKF